MRFFLFVSKKIRIHNFFSGAAIPACGISRVAALQSWSFHLFTTSLGIGRNYASPESWKVYGKEFYFNEFLSNLLAFSRSVTCQIVVSIASVSTPPRWLCSIHLHGIQALESKLRVSESKPQASSHLPPRNPRFGTAGWRPPGGVRPITFVLYTFVANDASVCQVRAGARAKWEW